jgi:uncharacterized protein (TIGR01777 family)
VVAKLTERGDEVHVLARTPHKAEAALGVSASAWDPVAGPPPPDALAGADGVVHLAGEPVAQRWNDTVKRRIFDSRKVGTDNLVRTIGALTEDARPGVLVCASASGYYGDRGNERLTEAARPGDDFLANVCIAWEAAAAGAAEHGTRHCSLRTGMVLDADGGALKTMLPIFKLGLGGPIAGGSQYVPWVHVDDLVGMYLRALDDGTWNGAYNASVPEPATNKEFTKALGRAVNRPAIAPVPAIALRVLFGGMSETVTASQRQVPERGMAAGFSFVHTDLDESLDDLLS